LHASIVPSTFHAIIVLLHGHQDIVTINRRFLCIKFLFDSGELFCIVQ